jgi:hypothetical protein
MDPRTDATHMSRVPRLSRRSVVLTGIVLGVAIWLIPALVLNEPEPWDDDGLAYPVSLFASGLLLGFVGPGQTRAAILAVFAGQFLVLLGRVIVSPGTSELWLVGALLLGAYTFVVTGLGALVGSAGRRRI